MAWHTETQDWRKDMGQTNSYFGPTISQPGAK